MLHGGSVDGYSSQLDRFVDDKLTVILLSNNERGPALALAKILADTYVPNLDATSIWSVNQRAHFAQQQGLFAEAARFYVTGLESGDNHPENAYYAARCFTAIGEKEKAFVYLAIPTRVKYT